MWDSYLQVASNLIENRQSYYKNMGKIASEIVKEYGTKGLKDFLSEVKDTAGQSASFKSMMNYAWIYRKLDGINLPDDITFNALQLIASTSEPKKWANRLIKDGLSSAEIAREIREFTGLKKPKKLITCPKCNEKFALQ